MATVSVLSQRHTSWRYWNNEPPAKAAARTYALRLWAVAQVRQLRAPDLAKMTVEADVGTIEHLQSTPDGENAPPSDHQRDLLARLARVLHVDPDWLLGDDSTHTFEHAGIGTVVGYANSVLRARAAPPPTAPAPPPPPNLAAPPSLDLTGMRPPPRPPRTLIGGHTEADLLPALAWLSAIDGEWKSQVQRTTDTRFPGRLRDWHRGLNPSEVKAAATHRHRIMVPGAQTSAPYPIYVLLPVELLSGFARDALLPRDDRPAEPDPDILRPALHWLIMDWSIPRWPTLPPPTAWQLDAPVISCLPAVLIATLGGIGAGAHARLITWLKDAWKEALRPFVGPDAIAERAAVDVQYRALVRVLMVTGFPREDLIDFDQAVACYQQSLRLLELDHSESIDQPGTLARQRRVVPGLPRQVEDLIEDVAGRIVSASAFTAWLGDIGAHEQPPVAADHFLKLLRDHDLVLDFHPVPKPPKTRAERAAIKPPQGAAPYLLVLDEDDRAWQVQQQESAVEK